MINYCSAGRKNIVMKRLSDERCPKHSLPSECLSASLTLSRDFSNHKDLSNRSVEKMNSLLNLQDFWGREMMFYLLLVTDWNHGVTVGLSTVHSVLVFILCLSVFSTACIENG